jgi:phosphohistidine phosphatase
MNLYLVRHAEAQMLGGEVRRDADRPLTGQGEHDAVMMGRLLCTLEPDMRRIATSPFLRSRHTAELLSAQFLRPPVVDPWPVLEPGISLRDVHAHVSQHAGEPLVIVAHQPDLTEYIAWLVADAAAEIAFPPGAAACITLGAHTAPGGARLHWIVPPAFVAQLHPEW